MCCIVTPNVVDSNKNMLSTKGVECGGKTFAVSPADECICLLSDPARVNVIKSKGMRGKHKGRALVSHNNYMSYTMGMFCLPDYKVVLPKGQFNGLRVHYNISTDQGLGLGWAALCRVACSCGSCKDQLERLWVLLIEVATQPHGHVMLKTKSVICGQAMRAQTTGSDAPSFQKQRRTRRRRGSWESIHCVLNVFELRMSLIVHKGKVGAVDKADVVYYLIK